jgi:pyruvate dehydrogenase E1 component beta subunit
VPLAETVTPIGPALLRRAGRHVTIVAHSYMIQIALEAAERLAADGVSCEVIDLRSLAPLDMEMVTASAMRTGALVIVDEGQQVCGMGAEIAFQVREKAAAMRVARVNALPGPVSSNPVLEAAALPDCSRVTAAIRRLLNI